MKLKRAISKIEKNGVLLVFPINNKPLPQSLWSQIYPGKKMNWEWDESGDNRVFEMWALMKKLSESGDVVYSKWYQSRATFFSKELFAGVIRLSLESFREATGISRTAREILDVLEQDSPLSTKKLKQICDLQGKDNAKIYDRSIKELFSRFLIVGFGEVDDGAFPSLAIAATKTIFEDVVLKAHSLKIEEAREIVDHYMPPSSLFRKYFEKTVGKSDRLNAVKS